MSVFVYKRDTVVVAGLEVDRAPVTNAAYALFVEAAGHRPPAYWPNGSCPHSLRDHPVVGVDFFDALAFAVWAEGWLPTEEQWTAAAGLAAPRAYPWGDAFDRARCNTVRSGHKGTTPVGAHAPAPSGCVDLAGNVWELTCSPHPEDPESVLVKGGSWYDYPVHARLDARFRAHLHKPARTVGFRLVYGVARTLPPGLDDDLVSECIEWRTAPPDPLPDAAAAAAHDGDFDAIVEELRCEAAEYVPAIDHEFVAEWLRASSPLDVLDAAEQALAEPEPAPTREVAPFSERVPANASARVLRLWDNVQELVTRHPRTMLVFLAAAALAVVGTVFAAAGPEAPALADRGTSGAALPVQRTDPARVPAARHRARADREALAGALRDLIGGNRIEREAAELRLLAEPERFRDGIETALARRLPAHAEESLKYVRARMNERPGAPRLAERAPRNGLVLFLATLAGEGERTLVEARNTARAHGLEFTVVYTGEQTVDAWMRDHARRLGGVPVYSDRSGALGAAWGARGPLSLAGLSADGRLHFLHNTRLARTLLADRLLRLMK